MLVKEHGGSVGFDCETARVALHRATVGLMECGSKARRQWKAAHATIACSW